MSQHGATLQTYNQELVKCLEDLKTKRNDLLQIVGKEEQEKHVLEKNIEALQEKLHNVATSLEKHRSLCDSYERTIQDTETGFKKCGLQQSKWEPFQSLDKYMTLETKKEIDDENGGNSQMIKVPQSEASMASSVNVCLADKSVQILSKEGDEFDVFGAFVASELRLLKSQMIRKNLKRQIQRYILETSDKEFENLVESDQSLPTSVAGLSSASQGAEKTDV